METRIRVFTVCFIKYNLSATLLTISPLFKYLLPPLHLCSLRSWLHHE